MERPMRTLYGGHSKNVHIDYSIHTLHETTKINIQYLLLIFEYKFQIKLALSVVMYTILAFFDHPVARKNETATDRSLCQQTLKAFL